jgi:YggT family protein
LSLLCSLVNVYFIILVARIIMSWFPVTPGTPMASVVSILYDLTEPVLGPFRRIIPPIGMIDISPIVVFFALSIVRQIVCA